MKLFFYGAAKEVTGSCYCIELSNKKLLVDCGMQQGKEEKNNYELPFNPKEIDYVVLTHGHIDHSGRLPLLVKKGFKKNIYAIKATAKLISIMLKDAAHIQESDIKLENKKAKRAGKEEKEPLYNLSDVENTLKLLISCNYSQMVELDKNVYIRFNDAGHILGSASVEIFLEEDNINKKIVFSGDIGNIDQPIINDPVYIDTADYVVMEATYGDRIHEKRQNYILELAKIIDKTLRNGGNVIIPSFAVGRTQGLLYILREIKEQKLVSDPNFLVYVDSPLAAEATELYDDDLSIYGDVQTKEILKKGKNPLDFPNLTFTVSVEASKSLNYDPTPKVIISSSGMCEGGRIRHHLKHNLWRNECSIIFVGFQAEGTLGRDILDGADKVIIFGEEIAVKASIYNFTWLSAHADRDGLIRWIKSFKKKPDKVFVVHGESLVCDQFVKTLENFGFKAVAPDYKQAYDLNNGNLIQ